MMPNFNNFPRFNEKNYLSHLLKRSYDLAALFYRTFKPYIMIFVNNQVRFILLCTYSLLQFKIDVILRNGAHLYKYQNNIFHKFYYMNKQYLIIAKKTLYCHKSYAGVLFSRHKMRK